MKHLQKIKLSLLFIIIHFLIFHPFNIQSQTIFKVPAYPHETCIADYDQDGDNDIIVGCSGPNQDPDSIVIFFNDGWGNFEQQKFERNNGLFIYCEDLDNDQYPDIITRDAEYIFSYKNNQVGGLGDQYIIKNTDGNPFIGGIDDINFDGYLDIVNYDITIPWGWGVVFNNGDYSFRDSSFVESSENTIQPAVGDLDNDGKADLILTTINPSDSIYLLYNNYPEFIRTNFEKGVWDPAYILNLNNDDYNDFILFKPLFFGNPTVNNYVYSEESFELCYTAQYTNGTWIENTCDYNLDGYDDITTTIYQANNLPIEDSIYIHFNDQHCGFAHVQSVYVGDYAWLPTVNSGDLNSDGYPELVIQGYHMPRNSIRILWNDGSGHFVDTNTVFVSEPEFQLKNQLEVFPNPTVGDVSVKIKDAKILSFRLLDFEGRMLLKKEWQNGMNEIDVKLKTNNIKPGIYLLNFQLDDQIHIIKKLIIKKPD